MAMRMQEVSQQLKQWLFPTGRIRTRHQLTPLLQTDRDPLMQFVTQAETLADIWHFFQTWVDTRYTPHMLLSTSHADDQVDIRYSLQPLIEPVSIPMSDAANHLVQSFKAGDTTFCGQESGLGKQLLQQLPGPHPQHWFSVPFRAQGRTIALLTLGFFQIDVHSQAQVSRAYLSKDLLAQLILNCLQTDRVTEFQREQNIAIQALMAALAAKDPYTGGHCHAVEQYAITLCNALQLEREQTENIRLAALLHDIGKIGIHDAILRKQGPLDADEWAIMRQHPEIGAHRILGNIPSLAGATESVLLHHERWDGSGYPYGLNGEAIPLGARIVSLVDAFHGLTSHRPYRPALSLEQTLALLNEGAGVLWDPELLQCFATLVQSRTVRAIQDVFITQPVV